MPKEKKDYLLIDDDYIHVKFLDWDTEYFGIQSGKVILKQNIESYSKDIIKECIEQFRFTNITNINNNPYNNKYLGENTKAFLVDINMQYEKNNCKFKSEMLQKENIQTIITNYCKYDQDMVNIATTAFSYSRFINDPNINNVEAHQLYAKWVINAFEKENKYFIMSYYTGKCVAFLLFSIENDRSIRIELLAVSGQFQKQRIGEGAIRILEKFAVTNDNSVIKVGTQLENILSNNFYPKQGFGFVSSHSIYHFWGK